MDDRPAGCRLGETAVPFKPMPSRFMGEDGTNCRARFLCRPSCTV